MTALCHACAIGVSSIAYPLGATQDPIGCCGICSALDCGHHGQRDPLQPLFVCVECDPSLLVRSVNPDVSASARVAQQTFASVDDFSERRPRYDLPARIDEYELDLSEPWHSPELQNLPPLSSERKRLLIVAGMLAHELLGDLQSRLLTDLRAHVRKRPHRWRP